MKRLLIFLLILLQVGLYAKLFKYTDSTGVHYVDSLSKVPKQSRLKVKGLSSRFLKTGITTIDKYRKIVSKKGVYYKELQNQKFALKAWGALMVNSGFKYMRRELSAIEAIDATSKKRWQRVRVAKKLSLYFKIFEDEWPKIYKKINFKLTNDVEIDRLRENYKKIKTTSENVSKRIELLERWSNSILKNPNSNSKRIKERLKGINELYDLPKPDMKKLIKYVNKTISIFEKEFNR